MIPPLNRVQKLALTLNCLRFRLRTLLVAVAVIGIALGIALGTAKWLREWPTRRYLRSVMQSESFDAWQSAHGIRLHGPTADPTIAVPALIDALGDERPRVRASVARALGHIREEAHSAIPSLIRLLKDEDAVVRSNVAASLGEICLDLVLKDAPAVSALKVALGDVSAHVRMAAAGALFRNGEVEAAIPALLSALTDEDEPVRLHAAWSLGGPRMVKFRTRVLPGLRLALRYPAASVRVAAAASLLGLDDPAGAIPVLAAARDDPDEAVRRDANRFFELYSNKEPARD